MPHTRTRTLGQHSWGGGQYEGGLDLDMEPNGHGVWTQSLAPGETRPGRLSYTGQWRHGYINCAGTYRLHSGMSYTGMWCDCYIYKGVIQYTDGTKYDGALCEMLRDGLGTFSWENGDRYEGTFTAGEMTGHGALYHVDGYTYVGSIERGVSHGIGVETYPSGMTYTGAFDHSQRHGLGTMTWRSGSTYIGAFRQDDIHGDGVFHERTEPAGDVLWSFHGSFEHDRPTAGNVRNVAGMTEYHYTFATDCEYIYNCKRAPTNRRVLSVCG